MKKILLWDMRQPGANPARLEIGDAIASACVRAGVATAADPAEAGALGAGAAIDPANPTEIVIWSGVAQRVRRVVVPSAVAVLAVAAGVAVLPGGAVTAGGTPTPTPTPSAIGGVDVGFVSSAGYTSGFKMLAGDDFDYASLSQMLLSGAAEGTYPPQRLYSRTDGNGYRGSAGLGGADTDPFWTGYADSNRGAPVGFADLITVSGSELLLRQRPATTQEKAFFQDPTKPVAGSMISTAAAFCAKAPFIWEARVSFQGSADTHLTDWFYQMGLTRDNQWLELDLEAGTSAAGTGNGNDYNCNQVVWLGEDNSIPSAVPAAPAGGGNSITPGTGYITFGMKLLADGTREYWVDGVCRAISAGYNSLALAKAFYRIWTNHVYAADGANINGYEDMKVAWHRIWVPDSTGVHYTPALPDQQINIDFDAAFSTTLPTKTALWGSEVTTELLDAVHLEESEPGIAYDGSRLPALLFAGAGYDGPTRVLSGRVNDRAGRKTLTRWVEGDGVSCKVHRTHVNVGPNIKVARAITLHPGATVDIYAACDVGVLLPKVISITGLPAGVTFNSTTGILTVSGGAADVTANVTINCTNSKSQAASKVVALTIKAANTYRDWAGALVYDADTDIRMQAENVLAIVPSVGSAANTLVGAGAVGTAPNNYRTRAIAVKNGRTALRINRLVSPVSSIPRYEVPTASPLSQMQQGLNPVGTFIVAFRPTDANTGGIFGWSDTQSNTANDVALRVFTRRNATASGLSNQTGPSDIQAVTWGSGDASGTDYVFAFRFNADATLDVWRNGTRIVTAGALGSKTFTTAMQFRLFAFETFGSGDPTFNSAQGNLDFYKFVASSAAQSDADIIAASTEIGAEWGFAA